MTDSLLTPAPPCFLSLITRFRALGTFLWKEWVWQKILWVQQVAFASCPSPNEGFGDRRDWTKSLFYLNLYDRLLAVVLSSLSGQSFDGHIPAQPGILLWSLLLLVGDGVPWEPINYCTFLPRGKNHRCHFNLCPRKILRIIPYTAQCSSSLSKHQESFMTQPFLVLSPILFLYSSSSLARINCESSRPMDKLLPLPEIPFPSSCSFPRKWFTCLPRVSLVVQNIPCFPLWQHLSHCAVIACLVHCLLWTMSSQGLGAVFLVSESQALSTLVCPQIVDT